MSIFCLSIVKNEDDIVGDVLRDASKWADKIFIADNGSSDDTVDVIQSVVAQKKNVEFLGVVDEPFTDEIRGKLYSRISHVSKPGDWWCRLDADEYYIDNPCHFLATLPADIDHVWAASYQFYFTDIDYSRYQQDPSAFLNTPLEQRFRYYLNNWSEPRFAKHTSYFDWPTTSAWPDYMVACANKRIRLRTYQHRSPEQVVKRLLIRNEVLARTSGRVFSHILNTSQSDTLKHIIGIDELEKIDGIDFREIIKDHSDLDLLHEDKVYIAREDSMPRLPVKNPMIPAALLYHLEKLKTTTKRCIKQQHLAATQ